MLTLFQLGTLGLPNATLECSPQFADDDINRQMLVTVQKEDIHVPIVTIAWVWTSWPQSEKFFYNVISTEYTHKLGALHRNRWLSHILTSPDCKERDYYIDDHLALLATIYDQVERMKTHQIRARGLYHDQRSFSPGAISRHGKAHQTVY